MLFEGRFDAVESKIATLRDLVGMKDRDKAFLVKYKAALEQDSEAAGKHGQLRNLLA